MSDFKLTYASLFNPPEEIHERFEATLAQMKADHLGKTHAMLINNQDVVAESTYENRSPINRHWFSFFFTLQWLSTSDVSVDNINCFLYF